MNERDPAKIPLLFPDPVIAFYLERVDRAALREQLKKTPSERLEWLEEQTKLRRSAPTSVVREEPAGEPVKKRKLDMGADPAWFAEAEAVPLLFPDPVVEAYLEDVDRGILRENVKRTVAERLEKFERFMHDVFELRGAFYKGDMPLWEEHAACNAGKTPQN
jgi:hypothetical protein